MANVEVQLDVKAEYKQALMAIAALGKALDAVQQRAKVALTVSGGAQGGSQGSGGTGEAETQQKAAVEALGAAMKEAAAAAATLAESVAKLTPALEAMGPQAEQVQQVLTLAEHYKQLAAAMGVAADAAAKYNASGAQQGETDARILKLKEENEALLEKIKTLREEQAELLKTSASRVQNAEVLKDEKENYKDHSYEMELSLMTMKELQQEIARLTDERKKAAEAKDDKLWEDKTEQLKIARKAYQKLRQEMQLTKITYMQQAQAAQAIGSSLRTVTEEMMNFSESAAKGTLNLTSMASAVSSLFFQLKAGLGPLGLALAGVEALTVAWNIYAKYSKKAAEEAEKQYKKHFSSLEKQARDAKKVYEEAQEAIQNYNDAQIRLSQNNSLLNYYKSVNEALDYQKRAIESSIKAELRRQALSEDAEEHAVAMKKLNLETQLANGEISQEAYDDELRKLDRDSKKARVDRDIKKKEIAASSEEKKENLAAERLDKAVNQLTQQEAFSKIFEYTPQQIEQMHKELIKNANAFNEANAKARNMDMFNSEERADWARRALLFKNRRDELSEILYGESTGGRYRSAQKYKADYEAWQKRLTTAKNEKDAAQDALYTARLRKEDAKLALDAAKERGALEYTQADEIYNAQTRKSEATRKARIRKEEEQAKKRAAEATRKEAERRAKLQSDAIAEGEYEGNLTKQARAIAKGKGYKMLADNKLSKNELAYLIKVAQQNSENEALLALIKDIIATALKSNMTTATAIKHQRAELNKLNINVLD